MKVKKRKLFGILAPLCALFACGGITTAAANAFIKTDTAYATKQLRAAPAVVVDVADSRTVQYVSADADLYATNLLIRIGDAGEVLDGKGRAIESLDAFMREAHPKIIPNFAVSSQAALEKLVQYATENDLTDAAVVSGDAVLLRAARDALPKLRGIYDATEHATFDGAAIAAAANRAGALVVILPASLGSKTNVEYLQARAKTVWLRLDGVDRFAAVAGIASGAFGLIVEGDPAAVAGAYDEFDAFVKPRHVLSRSPLVVAHRGVPYQYNENSLEGFQAAIEAGATHIEVDAHLTKDGEIVIMHDATIDRTTDGQGRIAAMTLEELRQYKIVKNYGGTPTGHASSIPTVDELFALSRSSDILLFFEIKTADAAFANIFRQKVEQYDMQDRIVVISFDRNQLSNVRREIPYLWALDLNDKQPTLGETVTALCERDVGADMSNGNLSIMRDMLERGFMPAAWTYATRTDVRDAAQSGVYALTNNDAVRCGTLPRSLDVSLDSVRPSDLARDDFTVAGAVVCYDGTRAPVDCRVLAYRSGDDAVRLVLIANAGDWYLMSDVLTVDCADEPPAPPQKSGCGAQAGSGATAAAILALTAAVALGKRKRGGVKHEN